MQHCAMGRE